MKTFKVAIKYFFLSFILFSCGGGSTATDTLSYKSLSELSNLDTVKFIEFDGDYSIKSVNGNFDEDGLQLPYKLDYLAQSADGRRIVGIETSVSDIPAAGTFSYSGTAKVYANNGVKIFTGDGVSSISFTSNSGLITFTLNQFDGISVDTDGNVINETPELQVIGDGTYTSAFALDDIEISGGFLSSDLSSAVEKSANVAFFGPSASEMGGILKVDDSVSGVFQLEGSFVAQQ